MNIPLGFPAALVLIACLLTPLRADCPPDAPPDAGQLAWVASSLSADSGRAESRAITTDEAGNSYVVGRFVGTVDFFGTTLTSTSSSVPSGFLAKFSRDGAPVFVKKIGSNAWTELLTVVVKPTGEIYVGGSVAGTFASGAVNFVVASTNGQNALLLRLDTNGDAVWGANYGGANNDSISALTLTRENHVAFGGNFLTSIVLGSSSFATYGSQDVFVARLDDGNSIYDIRRLGGTNSDLFKFIDVDGNNDLILGTSFNSNIELGSTVGQNPVTGSSNSFVIVKYSVNISQPLWYRNYSNATTLTLNKAVVNTINNSIVFAGQYAGTMNFGGSSPLPIVSGVSVYLVMLDGNGQFIWQRSLGATGSAIDVVNNIAASRSGVIGIAGRFESNLPADSCCGALDSNGQQSVYMAMLSATGECLWNRLAVGTATGFSQHVAATPDSDFVFAGFSGSGDFGSGPIPSGTYNREAFVAYYHGFSNFELGAPTTQAQWRENFFTVDELADATYSADDRDPDGDGTNNFFEYAYGQSPKQSDPPPALLVPQPPGDLLFTYKQNALATDLTYQLEWSDTLAPADWHTTGIVETVVNPNQFTRPIEAAVPRGTGKRFVRLKVTKP